MMEIVNAFCGQQVTIVHDFRDPDNPNTTTAPTAKTVRFKVYGPDGTLFADSRFHTVADEGSAVPANPGSVLPGQLLAGSAGTFLYLLSFPADATPGRYTVEALATIAAYTISDTIMAINLYDAPRVTVAAEFEDDAVARHAIGFWARTPTAKTIRLLRDIYTTRLADKTRLPVDPAMLFAYARHESGAVTDLTPLSSYTLLPGWTQFVVSSELFMVPVVDRLAQSAGYQQGPRWANCYYRDHLTYSINGVRAVTPLAWNYGPGPLFYLHLADPHWGCEEFKGRWESRYRIVADPSGAALGDYDSRRMTMICRPDFLNSLDFFAFAEPAMIVSLQSMRNHLWRPDYQVHCDLTEMYLNHPPNGSGVEHLAMAPEFYSSGPSSYYSCDVELTHYRPVNGSFDRFAVGYTRLDGSATPHDPVDTVSVIQ